MNVNDTSEIPGWCEPLFLTFDAEIDLLPVRMPQDLASGGPGIARAAKRYGGK